jgi:hypothetical protein
MSRSSSTLCKLVLVGYISLVLVACGGVPTAVEPTAVPTAAATAVPVPTLEEAAEQLEEQLVADKVLVQAVTAEDGALPTLTIAYDLPAEAASPADVGTAIERAIYTASKRIAQHMDSGLVVDRVALNLMMGEQQVASTRINARDISAWVKGDLTDQEYQSRWSQTVN